MFNSKVTRETIDAAMEAKALIYEELSEKLIKDCVDNFKSSAEEPDPVLAVFKAGIDSVIAVLCVEGMKQLWEQDIL